MTNDRNLRRVRGDGRPVTQRRSNRTGGVRYGTRTARRRCGDVAPRQRGQQAGPTSRWACVVNRRYPTLDELHAFGVSLLLPLLRFVFLVLNLIRAGFARHGPHHFGGGSNMSRDRYRPGLRRGGWTGRLGPNNSRARCVSSSANRGRHGPERCGCRRSCSRGSNRRRSSWRRSRGAYSARWHRCVYRLLIRRRRCGGSGPGPRGRRCHRLRADR